MMKIVTLVENICNNPRLKSAHGLSFYIETQHHKILFDFGVSDLLVDNAKVLGIDLSKVDIAVLSHGHNDHGGGIKSFIAVNSIAKIYINENVFRDYYAVSVDKKTFIGIDKDIAMSDRVILTHGNLFIDDELWILSEVSGEKLLSAANNSLMAVVDGKLCHDNFDHEQHLIVHSGKEIVLFAGCCHRGILNVLEAGEKLIDGSFTKVIAGFHLYNPSLQESEPRELINQIGVELDKRDSKYYTCHCTGIDAYKDLSETLLDKISYADTGSNLI